MVLRFLRSWYRRHRQQLRQFVYHNLLHADDPPHPLALGVAVGMFVAFTPTVGVQMVLAGFLSWLLRANKAVSIAVVWISNPGTMVPIYWYCYRIGCAILALDPIGRPWWAKLSHSTARLVAGGRVLLVTLRRDCRTTVVGLIRGGVTLRLCFLLRGVPRDSLLSPASVRLGVS